MTFPSMSLSKAQGSLRVLARFEYGPSLPRYSPFGLPKAAFKYIKVEGLEGPRESRLEDHRSKVFMAYVLCFCVLIRLHTLTLPRGIE